MPLLFTYGMLQRKDVQMATFGRHLDGRADALVGFELGTLRVEDPVFVAESGKADHAVVKFNGRDECSVSGIVYEVTDEELSLADKYEPAGYKRITVRLASGQAAWVYVGEDCALASQSCGTG